MMKKITAMLIVAALALVVVLSPLLRTTASTNVQSPMVGSWDLVASGQTPQQSFLFSFFADGNVIATDVNGATWHGSWMAENASVVDFDIHGLSKTEGGRGFTGSITIGKDLNNIPFMGGTLHRITVTRSLTEGGATPIS